MTKEELITDFEKIEQVCLTDWEKEELIKANQEQFNQTERRNYGD